MDHVYLTHMPTTNTGMRIRTSVADVFEAIVNPALTTQFWFTKSSGRLEADTQVRWEWEMYNVSIPVTVKVIEPHTRVCIEWAGYSGLSTVEWRFTPLEDGTTFVRVTESGFTGSGDELVKQVTDSTQGFALMLAGLKAFLEYDLRLNMVDPFVKTVFRVDLGGSPCYNYGEMLDTSGWARAASAPRGAEAARAEKTINGYLLVTTYRSTGR